MRCRRCRSLAQPVVNSGSSVARPDKSFTPVRVRSWLGNVWSGNGTPNARVRSLGWGVSGADSRRGRILLEWVKVGVSRHEVVVSGGYSPLASSRVAGGLRIAFASRAGSAEHGCEVSGSPGVRRRWPGALARQEPRGQCDPRRSLGTRTSRTLAQVGRFQTIFVNSGAWT